MRHDPKVFALRRFAIDALPESERFDTWREAVGRALLRLDFEPAERAPFRSTMAVRSLPDLVFSTAAISACRIGRTRELIADGRDDFGLVALTRGTATVSLGTQELHLRENEAVLLRNSKIGSISFSPGARYFNFVVPEEPLSARLSDVDAACMTPIRSDALRLALDYAELVLGEDGLLTIETQAAIARHFHDLAAAMIRAARGSPIDLNAFGVRAARLKAIKADILRNLDDHDLSLAAVAARHGITPRYVAKLFGSERTTFSAFVLKHRLIRVHNRLQDPTFARHSISAIAIDSGFGDLSHFNRRFRRRYGTTPSELRRSALKIGLAYSADPPDCVPRPTRR